MPGEDGDWLQDIALDIERGDGCFAVWEIGDQSTKAFIREGAKYL